jgi:hypothetical protein
MCSVPVCTGLERLALRVKTLHAATDCAQPNVSNRFIRIPLWRETELWPTSSRSLSPSLSLPLSLSLYIYIYIYIKLYGAEHHSRGHSIVSQHFTEPKVQYRIHKSSPPVPIKYNTRRFKNFCFIQLCSQESNVSNTKVRFHFFYWHFITQHKSKRHYATSRKVASSRPDEVNEPH